jgi:plastocyanin
MKTGNALFIFSLIFTFIAFSILRVNAQNDDKKNVRVKIVKDVDGVKTVIDTTYEGLSDMDLKELAELDIILKDLDGELANLDIEIDGINEAMDHKTMMVMVKELEEMEGDLEDKMKEIEIMIEMSDSFDSLSKHIEHEMKVIKSEDGKMVFINEDGDIEHIDMDGETMVWIDEDGKEHHINIEDGDHNIIVKTIKTHDGEEITTEIIDFDSEDGEETVTVDVINKDGKVIVINRNGEEIEIDHDIDFDADAEGHHIYITKDENGDMDEDVFVTVMKNKGEDGKEVYKSKIIISKLDKEDKELLKDSGVNFDSSENKLELERMKFSPNPSSGKFSLEFKNKTMDALNIKIYDLNGKEVYNEDVKNFDGHYKNEIDISSEDSGTYFLRISQNNKELVRKLVIN